MSVCSGGTQICRKTTQVDVRRWSLQKVCCDQAKNIGLFAESGNRLMQKTSGDIQPIFFVFVRLPLVSPLFNQGFFTWFSVILLHTFYCFSSCDLICVNFCTQSVLKKFIVLFFIVHFFEQKKELTDIKTSYDSIKTLKFQILYLKHPRLSAEKQHFFSFIKPLFEKANMIFVSENIMLLYGNK